MNTQDEIEFLRLLRKGILKRTIVPRGMEKNSQYCDQFAEVYSDQLTKIIRRLEALELSECQAASSDS